MSTEENTEQTSLISKLPEDVETGGKGPAVEEEAGMMKKVFWLSLFCAVLIAGVVITSLQLTGNIDPFDDDDSGDDGDDGDDDDGSKRPPYCSLEAIVSEGGAVACHDPTGCSGPDDETEWCFVSDSETPVAFAFSNIDLLMTIDRDSFLAQAGTNFTNLSPTCIINACQNRKCACVDNGNGTSNCPGIHKENFPFTNIAAGTYRNCEAEDEVDPEEAEVEETLIYQGQPTLCACKDVQGCKAYDGQAPGFLNYNTDITESLTDRCYVSLHHDGTLDTCVPEACGMVFACDCVDHGNGTSTCPTQLPFRDVKDVPNCEEIAVDIPGTVS
eukprot:CAMPEP_0118922170 /NCGR_PEP_ID=MMETSP1169-20130426/1184_1 /TAXON_ID=36882 /ORGANISM="Pyramimonas obovata, Strain CCMP722" /LENGTH=328 /DNA_ID=CAMNT_0006862999 /DNA_START=233 /DNA_END=1219 /DNA_ORIENTATION=-